jgi:EAL domain-containing protein (putative c-di-GMP-specific phosphodiesterase class I)
VNVSVNLSNQLFRRPDLVSTVKDILRETGLPPQSLELELTEGIVMDDANRSASLLKALKELGVSLSIDDFGTGYSSLSYLKCLPVDKLKIDRSFVKDLDENHSSAAITRAIITLAHNLRLRVIAEGVETEGQLSFLRKSGCDEIQGFLISRPVKAEDAGKLIVVPESTEIV